jgi:UDP-N-acetyl-D-glucosamine dehydrogenase
MTPSSKTAGLKHALDERSARVGVLGLGYVGLPLAMAIATGGYRVLGFDIDPAKVAELNKGSSYIGAVTSEELSGKVTAGRFRATDRFDELPSCDVLVICVPTPLTRQREPDLTFIEVTARAIAEHLRPGQLISLESTTYPGTTNDVVKPILEKTGLRSGEDFFLAYSPEREDPGSQRFHTAAIPKVVSGDGADATALAVAFYAGVVERVVPVSTNEVAEAVKITENIFRAVNIALVNELKVIYDAMGIDVWEVIEAAKTKPFGFMPFYPGPGLGGHCIPIDPFYLTWKAREYEVNTRFIELAGEINTGMPRYVIARLERALDERQGLSLGRARILILGVAYKKNVADIRESPSLKLMELLLQRGTSIDFHDPHVPVIPPTREHPTLAERKSVDVGGGRVGDYDAVLIATDHDAIDYASIVEGARLVVDTRNACGSRGLHTDTIVKA